MQVAGGKGKKIVIFKEPNTSWEDPVQFSFAHGGKDGVPFPIDRNTFDRSIRFLREAIEGGEITGQEKRTALKNYPQI